MKNILLFGSGVSVPPMCDYLSERGYSITIVSRNEKSASELAGQHPNLSFVQKTISFEDADSDQLNQLVKNSDMVVSFTPGRFLPVLAELCLKHKVSLITSSHIGYLFKTQKEFDALDQKAKDRGIAIIAEAGIDPGYGSMVGKKIIDTVHAKGGKVIDMWVNVGVLPCKEDVNPFNYKCYWAPRKALFTSVTIKDGAADWIKNSQMTAIKGNELYPHVTTIEVPGIGTFESYPNGDSGAYLYQNVYGLNDVRNFYHGDLRYPGWSKTFQGLIDIGFSDSQLRPDLIKKTYREIMLELCGAKDGDVKALTAQKLNVPVSHDIIARYEWLGLFDNKPILPPIDKLSYSDVIADLLTHKISSYKKGDPDVDQFILYYDVLAQYPEKEERITSIAHFKGKQGDHSICTKMTSETSAMVVHRLLEGSMTVTGLQYPVIPEIYEPILKEYADAGLESKETIVTL